LIRLFSIFRENDNADPSGKSENLVSNIPLGYFRTELEDMPRELDTEN
jgi:hypothetical protein